MARRIRRVGGQFLGGERWRHLKLDYLTRAPPTAHGAGSAAGGLERAKVINHRTFLTRGNIMKKNIENRRQGALARLEGSKFFPKVGKDGAKRPRAVWEDRRNREIQTLRARLRVS